MGRGTKGHRLVHAQRCLKVAQHNGSRAIRHQRTVRAFQRTGNKGVLLAFGTAKLETQKKLLWRKKYWVLDENGKKTKGIEVDSSLHSVKKSNKTGISTSMSSPNFDIHFSIN